MSEWLAGLDPYTTTLPEYATNAYQFIGGCAIYICNSPFPMIARERRSLQLFNTIHNGDCFVDHSRITLFPRKFDDRLQTPSLYDRPRRTHVEIRSYMLAQLNSRLMNSYFQKRLELSPYSDALGIRFRSRREMLEFPKRISSTTRSGKGHHTMSMPPNTKFQSRNNRLRY